MEVIAAADTVVDRPAMASEPRRGRTLLARLCKPSLSDLFFAFVTLWIFVINPAGGKYVLQDADTALHLRIGQHILNTRAIPSHDLFSFSKPDGTWYAFEWLAETLFAWMYNLMAWKGIVLLAGILIALYSTVLLKYMLWKGVNGLVAIVILAPAVDGASIHFLARPHLFTLLYLSIAIWLLEYNRRGNGKQVWLLVPMVGIWANTHGGFVMFFVLLGLRVAGCVMEGQLWRDCAEERWEEARQLSFVGAACGLASLVNPYGIHLHLHVLEILRSRWIMAHVSEFLAPSFRSEQQYAFMALLFAGIACVPVLLRKKSLVEPLWILFLAYCSLSSVRHITIYVLVAGPIVALEISEWWTRVISTWPKSSVIGIVGDVSQAFSARLSGTGLLIPVVTIAYAVSPGIQWPTSFPDGDVPVKMIEAHAGLLSGGRLFTSDQIADYLIFRNQPRQRVFIDSRHNYYGETLGDDYVAILNGSGKFGELLDRYRFDQILCATTCPAASLAQAGGGWQVIDKNRKHVLLQRRKKF